MQYHIVTYTIYYMSAHVVHIVQFVQFVHVIHIVTCAAVVLYASGVESLRRSARLLPRA